MNLPQHPHRVTDGIYPHFIPVKDAKALIDRFGHLVPRDTQHSDNTRTSQLVRVLDTLLPDKHGKKVSRGWISRVLCMDMVKIEDHPLPAILPQVDVEFVKEEAVRDQYQQSVSNPSKKRLGSPVSDNRRRKLSGTWVEPFDLENETELFLKQACEYSRTMRIREAELIAKTSALDARLAKLSEREAEVESRGNESGRGLELTSGLVHDSEAVRTELMDEVRSQALSSLTWNQTVVDLRCQLAAFHKAYDEVKSKCDWMVEERGKHTEEVARMREAHNNGLAGLVHHHKQMLAGVQVAYKSNIDKAKQDSASALSAMQQHHFKEITCMKTKYEKRVNSLKEQHQKELSVRQTRIDLLEEDRRATLEGAMLLDFTKRM